MYLEYPPVRKDFRHAHLVIETAWFPVAFRVLYTARELFLPFSQPGYIWDTTSVVVARGNDYGVEDLIFV